MVEKTAQESYKELIDHAWDELDNLYKNKATNDNTIAIQSLLNLLEKSLDGDSNGWINFLSNTHDETLPDLPNLIIQENNQT